MHPGIEQFSTDIEKEPVIWFEGRAKVGPRALGHRSILADPRKIISRDLLNKYKQREWWRPVAPIILESQCAEWFVESKYSPFMLNNFTVHPEKKEKIPAVLHIDNTARVQTIGPESELLYQAVEQFYARTGTPIVCNTSLNDKGEPIVNTIDEALNFALRKNIHVDYINGVRFQLTDRLKYPSTEVYPRNRSLGQWSVQDHETYRLLQIKSVPKKCFPRLAMLKKPN